MFSIPASREWSNPPGKTLILHRARGMLQFEERWFSTNLPQADAWL